MLAEIYKTVLYKKQKLLLTAAFDSLFSLIIHAMLLLQ